MTKLKIVFLCHFSNPMVREKLDLRKMILRSFLSKMKGNSNFIYDDYAIWVSDYIEEFEKHKECECHIVAPHLGMKRSYQFFDIRGIKYHFWSYKDSIFHLVVNKLFNIDIRSNYKYNRNKVRSIINKVNPDIVLLCGAENPYYSLAALDVNSIPIYVILQTFLNDSKRIKMGVGNDYSRKIELNIFRHANYFCTSNENAINYLMTNNNKATILPAGFPTHRPNVMVQKKKDYDFVFFARTVTVNKGVEDALRALSIIKEKGNFTLNVIGGIEDSYHQYLVDLCEKLDISDCVFFSGYYKSIQETYDNVVRSRIVVVPGITAALNSTIRESMFMGMPVICYETEATKIINKDQKCLFTAIMSDVSSLAEQMLMATEDNIRTQEVAWNGKNYAESMFGNEAIVNKLIDNCFNIVKNQF